MINSSYFPFLFPLLAVVLGYAIVIIYRKAIDISIKLLLSFSGAFLLSATVFDFLPVLYRIEDAGIGIFIMLGIIVQLILEYGSKGAEHGHMHTSYENKFPLLLFVSLAIHAFVEGFPIVDNQAMLLGVIVHKLPIAIILSFFMLSSKLAKIKIVFFLLGFALMTPLGALAKTYLPVINEFTLYADSFSVGILLHVSTTILFESSKNHTFNASRFFAIIVGIIIAYLL